MKKRNRNLQREKIYRYFGMGVAVFATAMFLSIPIPVYATESTLEEVTLEMQENGTDGLPDEDGNVTDTSSRVSISDGIVYDTQQENYLYSVGTGYIYANVLNNMITQDAVKITADAGIEFTVYKNGDVVELGEEQTLNEAGSYTVMNKKSDDETAVFSFIIIGESIREPQTYDLPSTCVVTSVSLNNEVINVENRSIDLSEEGDYHIEYLCARNNVTYELEFSVDHTAPTLTFEGLKNNKAKGKVTIDEYEEGATPTIQKDGSEITSRSELVQPGAYTVKITDKAGNSSVYSFYILFYINAGGIAFGIVTIAVVAALIVYLYISRKRMRVR